MVFAICKIECRMEKNMETAKRATVKKPWFLQCDNE